MKVHLALSRLLSVFVLVLLAGCAGPSPAPLVGLVPGKQLESLTSSISLSLKTPGRSIGGRGFLVFKQPGRFHVALLSPFGTTLADIYSDGRYFTSIIPSRQVAFAGPVTHLPERDGLQALALMQWVLERMSPGVPNSRTSTVSGAGVSEQLYFDSMGLLVKKEAVTGDRVTYRDYRNVEGLAFPGSIEVVHRGQTKVRIVFEEPEVNRQVGEEALTPMLGGFTVLPFSAYGGF